VPKGSVLHVVAHDDNTAGNPRNPNRPPKLVKWGETTTDEMCVGFLAVTKKGQDLTRPGEKDDLGDILAAQRKDEVERYRPDAKKRASRPRPGRVNPSGDDRSLRSLEGLNSRADTDEGTGMSIIIEQKT
jgi:hypothetical protein